MKLRFLCPKKEIPQDSITNLYGTGSGEYAHFHDKWAYHPTRDRFRVANCTVTPFFHPETGRSLRTCLPRAEMRQKASGKFRLFCLAEFPPKNLGGEGVDQMNPLIYFHTEETAIGLFGTAIGTALRHREVRVYSSHRICVHGSWA